MGVCVCAHEFNEFILMFQGDSVDSGAVKGLHNIENGETNYRLKHQRLISNEILIPALNTNFDHQSSEENQKRCEHSTVPIKISSKDSQPQSHNGNIKHTNESICNSNTHNGNGVGNGVHAIIDIVSPTHTNNDHTNVTTKSTLPYTTTSNIQHKNINDTNNDVDVNSNASGTEESNRKQQKLSNKIVLVLRRSKPIALVLINCLLAILIAISLCISMGLDYTVPAIVVGLIAVVASSGLWYWLYIAAVTAPRDIR